MAKKMMVAFLGIFVLSFTPSVFSQTATPEKQAANTPVRVQAAESNQVMEQVSTLGNDEMIGGIDWENKIVYAVGDGVPPQNAINPAQARARAKRAAMDEAYARLLETVQEVRVDAESTTRNFVNENRTVHTKVDGLIKHAEIHEMKQASDGSYQVKMRMPINGMTGLSSAILPIELSQVRSVQIVSHVTRQDPGGKPTAGATATQPTSASKSDEPTKTTEKPGQEVGKAVPAGNAKAKYTSLIVSAKGLNAKPALYPVIQTQSGKVVYNLEVANPNAAIEEGLCTYRKSLEEAKKLPKAGTNPLIVEAVGVGGTYGVNLLLSDEDVEKIVALDQQAGFLKDANVIVVID